MKTYLYSAVLILLAISMSGCAYKFVASDLEYIEFHEPTNITEWRAGNYNKITSLDFAGMESNGDYSDTDLNLLQDNITALINKNKLQLGLYSRNESCSYSGFEPGYVEIRYKQGTIMIEEDPCNITATNRIYDDIRILLKL